MPNPMALARTLCVLAGLICAGAAAAQPATNPRIESLRIAFVTERLELTPQESEAFWPAIRVHHRELESLRSRIDALYDEVKAGVSEKRATEIYAQLNSLHRAELERRELLIRDAATTIGYARALRLPAAEREFRMRVAEEIRERRGGPPPRH
jgi:hypothetical protein